MSQFVKPYVNDETPQMWALDMTALGPEYIVERHEAVMLIAFLESTCGGQSDLADMLREAIGETS
jgi:hypothetical protein